MEHLIEILPQLPAVVIAVLGICYLAWHFSRIQKEEHAAYMKAQAASQEGFIHALAAKEESIRSLET